MTRLLCALLTLLFSLSNPAMGESVSFRQSSLAAETEANVTRLGITRNNPADWRTTRDLWGQTGYGGILSDANRVAIGRGRTPVCLENALQCTTSVEDR
jgi:hypothetical protein